MPTPNPAFTTQQLLALASIVPREKPQTPCSSRHLRPFLHMMRSKWVRDFVFTPDPIHMRYLLSPTFPSSALTCVMESATINPHVQPPVSPTLYREGHFFSGHILFVPVFTVDQLTVGVGVVDAKASVSLPYLANTVPGNHVSQNLRFARDAATQTLLLVYDLPHDDSILVVTSCLDSPTHASKLSAIFRRSMLRHVFLGVDHTPRSENILPAMLFFQVELHRRPCAVCRSTLPAPCHCRFPRLMSGHPMDSSFFLRGMAWHLCESSAVANKVVYDALRQPHHTVLGSRMLLSSTGDPTISQRLCNWSVQQHARDLREHPLQSLILSATHARATGVGDDAQAASTLPGRSAPALNAQDVEHVSMVSTEHAVPQEMSEDMTHCGGQAFGLTEVAWIADGRHLGYMQPGSRSGYVEEQVAWWEEKDIEADVGQEGTSAAFVQYPLDLAPMQPNCSNMANVTENSTDGMDRLEGNTLQNSFSANSFAQQAIPSSGIAGLKADVHSATGRAVEVSAVAGPIVRRKSARLIAPRVPVQGEIEGRVSSAASAADLGQAQPSSSHKSVSDRPAASPNGSSQPGQQVPAARETGVPSTQIIDADLAERRRKAQIRRDRNRAAARRSNQKQKAVRDELRVQLREIIERVERLRGRELVLRKENLELRKALSGMLS